MSNFSIENIGAFELNNALHVSSDAALEGVMPLIASPTSAQPLCSQTMKMGTAGCVSHDDAALETAAAIAVTPTHGVLGCPTFDARCGLIDGGALYVDQGDVH